MRIQWMDYIDWRERFAAVLDPRQFGIEDLDRRILDDSVRIWTSPAAAIVAEIKQYPRCRTVRGMIAAGEMKAIKALIPLAEAWGREQGCIAGEIVSRPGWARAMRADGYELSQVNLWKDL